MSSDRTRSVNGMCLQIGQDECLQIGRGLCSQIGPDPCLQITGTEHFYVQGLKDTLRLSRIFWPHITASCMSGPHMLLQIKKEMRQKDKASGRSEIRTQEVRASEVQVDRHYPFPSLLYSDS